MPQSLFYMDPTKGALQSTILAADMNKHLSLHPRWQRRIWQAIDYIHNHYCNHISQEALSVEVNMSVPKLQSGIKQLTGHTLYSYHEQIKIKAAKVLLEETDLPLKAIAQKVGFKTHSHFGEVFKRLTQMTPSAYRNEYGQ
jgi:AraC-like DNA-binding protein